ncbi:hypothetical protein PMAYCL1PPCAC_10441, partial [Pristionchus mayeri]
SKMLVALGTVLLVSSAFAGIVPPHLERCANITISESNCPRKGYECSKEFEIEYKARNNEWHKAEVKCVDEDAQLAVGKKIVDKVKCRDQQWRAHCDEDDFRANSVVCAKSCDADVCHAAPHDPPSKFKPLNIRDATVNSKCAFAKCKNGFVAVNREGDVLEEFPASAEVTCGGNRKWNVASADDTLTFKYMMCKRKAKPCDHDCDEKPWGSELLNATSAAIRDGCSYSCPEGEALSRYWKTKKYATALTCATCTHNGYLVDNDKTVSRIGCFTCDIPDGDVPNLTIKPAVPLPATSKGCVATCPKDFVLQYSFGSRSGFVRDNIIYRQFLPDDVNKWITNDGVSIDETYKIECVNKHDCVDWEDHD